jgi:hypothetical protein
MCWAMHGTVHTLDERLDDHPNGRCTAIPHFREGGSVAAAVQVESREDQFARLELAAVRWRTTRWEA